MRRKVAFIIPDLNFGGAEKVFSILVNNINVVEFEPILILINAEGPFLENITNRCKIYDLKCKHVRGSAFKLLLLLRELKPDVVMSTLGHLNLMVAILCMLLPNKIKFIGRETNISSLRISDTLSGKFLKFVIRKLYQNLSLIVCQSELMKVDLNRNIGVPLHKLVVINNPVLLPDLFREHHESLGNDKNGTYKFMIIGRLVKFKQFDHVVKAISLIKGNDIELMVLGDGEEKEHLKGLVEQYDLSNKVKMLGFKPNPYHYICQSDCLIITSNNDGFPNVVLEALVCGKPVIAYNNVPSINEIINNKRNGMLVTPDIESLAEAMNMIQNMQFSASAIAEDAHARFGVETILKKYETAFRK